MTKMFTAVIIDSYELQEVCRERGWAQLGLHMDNYGTHGLYSRVCICNAEKSVLVEGGYDNLHDTQMHQVNEILHAIGYSSCEVGEIIWD